MNQSVKWLQMVYLFIYNVTIIIIIVIIVIMLVFLMYKIGLVFTHIIV